MESEQSAGIVINNEVVKDAAAERDGEQDNEMFCRVCDPVDGDIDDKAEDEAEAQRPFRDLVMPRRERSSCTALLIYHRDHGALIVLKERAKIL